ISQLAGLIVPLGTPATLTVGVDLPSMTYQWYAGASGTMTTPVSGATSASMTVSPAATTTYWCRIASSCTSVNSNAATVTVCTPPSVSAAATTVYSSWGQPATMSVGASGTSLTYQWYSGTSGNTASPLSGRTSA